MRNIFFGGATIVLLLLGMAPFLSPSPEVVEESIEKNNLEIPDNWNTSKNDEIGIKFSHPTDWNVSKITIEIIENNFELRKLRIYPDGFDPTAVWFFVVNTPISNIRTIEITKSNIHDSNFESFEFGGLQALRRIDSFTYNDCTNTITLIERNERTYGSEIVACPTHPDGYDQIRIDIANSLEIL